jgi:hypothetical protein
MPIKITKNSVIDREVKTDALFKARLATGEDDFVQGKYFTATVLSCP